MPSSSSSRPVLERGGTVPEQLGQILDLFGGDVGLVAPAPIQALQQDVDVVQPRRGEGVADRGRHVVGDGPAGRVDQHVGLGVLGRQRRRIDDHPGGGGQGLAGGPVPDVAVGQVPGDRFARDGRGR